MLLRRDGACCGRVGRAEGITRWERWLSCQSGSSRLDGFELSGGSKGQVNVQDGRC